MSGAVSVVVHADEACLGNGTDPPNPGGAGGLVEVERDGQLERYDYFLAEPDTTNNRMAIRSAIEALRLLEGAGLGQAPLLFVSDSTYLVEGMKTWIRNWKKRGWKRKVGDKLEPVKNEALWRELDAIAEGWPIEWKWVRGHAGNVKNEYVDGLATTAAKTQQGSAGLIASAFTDAG